MNILIPFLYEGYSWITQTVSELSAVDAPTRSLWMVLGTTYTLLVAVFGWGFLRSANRKQALGIVGIFDDHSRLGQSCLSTNTSA
jgi:hypothetical protein